ncbi:MAG TPA: dual specificity protein phosphatase family protein [Planctomycetota bacterium]|nr:dual specificity protein phosphatase family protein [Planctomycetota bacterium]
MPNNFSFVIDGVLAGMERPGTFSKLRDDLEFLKLHKIHAIVSLTETPLERAFIDEFGFRYLHLPIADFTAPSIEQIEKFLTFQRKAEADTLATVVHCGAGLGRTGTMLACALVSRGLSAEAAIDHVRTQRPYSIETLEQEDAVRAYAEFLAKRAGPIIINDLGDDKLGHDETRNRRNNPDNGGKPA